MSKTFKIVLIVAGIIIVLVATCLIVFFVFYKSDNRTENVAIEKSVPINSLDDPTEATNSSNTTIAPTTWQEVGSAIEGGYADAEVVTLADGTLRMYYTTNPESGRSDIYSSTSTDGVTWTQESGIRKPSSNFTDIVKLADGTYRMYFQSGMVIKSATSTDGLTWTDELGTRIDKIETGFNLDGVAAPTTQILDDGTYIMVYRGTELKPYGTQKLPNQNTQVLFYATSTDGLTWTKKGLSVDTRNETFKGLADGPEFVKWDDGTLRLYFWGYKGVYFSTFADEKFSDPQFTFSNSADSLVPFPQNPPGDPTLVKIKDQWFMYYGQFTKGIYYATLK